MRALTIARSPFPRTWRRGLALGVIGCIGQLGCGSSSSDEDSSSQGGSGGGSTTSSATAAGTTTSDSSGDASGSGGTTGNGGSGDASGSGGTTGNGGSGGDTTSTVTSSTAASGSDGSTGGTAGGGSGGGAPSEGVTCVARGAFCRAEAPPCPEMQVPSVDGTCWGECVPIGDCVCEGPDDCPDANQYTCHNFSGRCGPYL